MSKIVSFLIGFWAEYSFCLLYLAGAPKYFWEVKKGDG
jgi:hypothetical protein